MQNFEKLPVRIYEDDRAAAKAIARRIADLIRARAAQRKPAVLGLPTGNTPINVYRELVRMHKEERLDFSGVISFNLDEYWPVEPGAFQSYHNWMDQNLFRHVNVRPRNVHIPSGEVAEGEIESHCRRYETEIKKAGGIDLQILGIGRSGHIGFNEPGSSRESRTRLVHLDTITRKDAASDFFGEENVPGTAITMGVGTILEAREICLMAFGEHKAPIIRRAVEGEVSSAVAAGFLQQHGGATVYLDQAAAADLTRVATPWQVGSCQWDEMLTCQAVIWLARTLKKPILKLTDEDYAENGLVELLRHGGGAYRINLVVFHRLMGTITGWPGGKKEPRRVLILSPHPDDDVICMAGTMVRFVEQGHEVHAAYMTSGYLSVFDYDVERYAEFVKEFNEIFALKPEHSSAIADNIDKFLLQKRPGELDSQEVQAIKTLVRRTEAMAAAKYCGLKDERIHFLNMPFYNTGRVQKSPIGPADIAAVRGVLQRVHPQMVFAAGDMSDPHGTHRQCLEAALRALEEYEAAGNPSPELWLYRGAWQEWPPEQIDMAVPLSPDELRHKRYAIFRHQSQKDRAMFPGPFDSREFWQRAEDRSKSTAAIYDLLGLPEYHAIEAFVKWPVKRPANLMNQLTPAEEPPRARRQGKPSSRIRPRR